MRAMVITEPGGPEVLQLQEVPDPVPGDGEVLIRVKAFGINHAETHMRKGEWPEATPISGIEAVGTVAEDPAGRLANGTKVLAIMGGLGRIRNGSYAEYTVAPVTNVSEVETSLDWTDLAAVPESYATAWLGLHCNLADEIVIDTGEIAEAVRQVAPGGADRVLDLVGNSVLRDSLRAAASRGRVCQAGLGGLGAVRDFMPVFELPSGVQFSFFGSFEVGGEAYPLSAVPFQEIIGKVEAGAYRTKPARVFEFSEIGEAQRIMEAGQAAGKLVVRGL
jgi:NADPH:quinone reductase